MIYTIENDKLRIQVKTIGAELTSIYDKVNDREVLWQADPAFWPRQSPVLFPNVGRHYGDHYTVNGEVYPSSQHGFARDGEFECTESTDTSLTFQYVSDEETLTLFPFEFLLEIIYTLDADKLVITWRVKNIDEQTMYFTIGGHPAFNIPALSENSDENCRLTFSGQDSLNYYLIAAPTGTADTGKTYTLKLTDNTFAMEKNMFDQDALIFDGGQISRAGIQFADGTPYLEVISEDFPCYGIWSKPGAPFVCLEPWMGRCDDYGFTGELSDKTSANKLGVGEKWTKTYSLQIF